MYIGNTANFWLESIRTQQEKSDKFRCQVDVIVAQLKDIIRKKAVLPTGIPWIQRIIGFVQRLHDE